MSHRQPKKTTPRGLGRQMQQDLHPMVSDDRTERRREYRGWVGWASAELVAGRADDQAQALHDEWRIRRAPFTRTRKQLLRRPWEFFTTVLELPVIQVTPTPTEPASMLSPGDRSPATVSPALTDFPR